MYYEYTKSLDSRVDRQSAFFTWIAHADENNNVMCRFCYFRERNGRHLFCYDPKNEI